MHCENRQIVQLGIGEAERIPPGAVASMLVGSCVGLFIYNPQTTAAAAAHVALPVTVSDDCQGKYADTAPAALLRLMHEKVGCTDHLVVKIAGAACMFGTRNPQRVGELNMQSIQQSLTKIGLCRWASHVGGDSARQLHFDSRDGSLRVTLASGETVEI